MGFNLLQINNIFARIDQNTAQKYRKSQLETICKQIKSKDPTDIHKKSIFSQLQNKICEYQLMSSEVPLLTLEQVQQLNYMIHGILQQNKKKLDETLGEQVQISNTSILGLYRLVTQQWNKKQKIVDNLCHFSITMMSTVQFLWQQKDLLNDRLETAQITINNLQKELDEVMDLNEVYRQKISEAENHIQQIAEVKQKIEELVRSQSCMDFSAELENGFQCLIHKKCSAQNYKESACDKNEEINLRKASVTIQIQAQIQNLREEKKKLELQLEEAIEEKQLTKMELQLAQIAIKDALTYKTSFRSLIHSNSSKLEDRPRQESNIHYYNGEIDCNSIIDESFDNSSKNVLSNEFTNRQDIIHFASTPCLLLNDSIEKINLDPSLSSLRQENEQRIQDNPFKKKIFQLADHIPSKPSEDDRKHEDLNISIEDIYQNTHKQENNKTFDLKNESRISSYNQSNNSKHPESMIINQKRFNEDINKSKIQDRSLTYESSLMSSSVCKRSSDQLRSTASSNQSSISKFYNFVTKKVVKGRIKVK